jgi:hypothetical protein
MSRGQLWLGLGLAAAGPALLVVGIVNPADRRREGRDLDARLAAAHARLVDKHEVTEALMRGDIGFREAADHFRPLVAGYPAALNGLRQAHPGAGETELVYRHVLAYVRAALSDRPDIDPGLLARLEGELAATFPTGGPTFPLRIGGPYRFLPMPDREK